jgi:fatty-acyl-CoA synthase
VAAAAPSVPSLRHLVEIDDGTPVDVDRPVTAVDYEEALAAEADERDFDARSPDDLYVLYTGGTTGMPKGVLWRHEDIFFAAMGGGDFFGPGVEHPTDVAAHAANGPVVQLVAAPMMHGAAQWVGWMSLTSAGTLVLYCNARFDPDEVWRLAESERANVLTVVGDAMARPLADLLSARPDDYDLSSLITVGSGGAILSPTVKQQLRASLPATMIVDGFGASETGANGRLVDLAGEGNADGPPRFTMEEHTAVLDDDLRPVAPGSGIVGRLARRGHIPLGYHKDDAKTAATFPVDEAGVRWSVPGDYAVAEADGTVTVLGRGSVSINTGGEKVFPEEVEAALKAHPAVFDAVVVGVADERFGERVAAVVAVRPGMSITSDDVAEHCRAKIAGYKVPRQVHVVDEVVRSPAGKPDYRWAKALAAAGTPIG